MLEDWTIFNNMEGSVGNEKVPKDTDHRVRLEII